MQCFALQGNLTVRETTAAGKSATAGANCRIALDARSACSAVACVPLRYANTCREPTEYIFGSHQRSSRRFAISFRSFLVRTRKEHVSPLPRRRYVLFSLRRKAPKDSPRRCLGLSCFCWGAYTHGSQQLFALALRGKPTFAVREVRAAGKSAPAGANCRIALAARSACSAVDCTSLPSANTCREPTRCVFDSHERSSRIAPLFEKKRRAKKRNNCKNKNGYRPAFELHYRLRLLFVLFLSVQEKNTFLLSKGEEYVVFSPTRKRRKESPRLPSRTLMLLLGSIYPRLERCCSARKARTGHHSPCEKFVRLETPRPQAQTAGLHSPSVRRVPPWIARVYRVQTRAGSRRDAFSARTNGQAGGLQFF